MQCESVFNHLVASVQILCYFLLPILWATGMASNREYIALQPKHNWDYASEHDATSPLNEDTAYDRGHQRCAIRIEGQSWISRTRNSSLSGVLWVTLLTAFITLINLGLTIALMIAYPTEAGIGEALVGSCADVASWSRWLHIGINVLSSGLLGASNYCMQRLCAPTRTEVDSEHSNGSWLDIGVPSVRNFKRISRKRKVLWLLLGFSSIPLHLLFVFPFLNLVIRGTHLTLQATIRPSFPPLQHKSSMPR